jgi:hypothetical protein
MNTNNTIENKKFIKIGETVINESKIRWLRKIDECIEICTKSNGCGGTPIKYDTHVVCRINKPTNYDKLHNLYFENSI